MNICCINPPIQDFYSTSLRRQPLGLLYVIAALEQAGHSVTLINGHTPKKHIMPTPDEFAYLVRFMKSDDANTRFPFKNYCHYGASFEEIKRGIKACDAEIFFISCLFTTYFQETAEIISLIRKIKKNAIIVSGGYHAAQYPEFYLGICGANYVITGEGENASVSLMEHLAEKIDISDVPDLCYRDGNSIRRTEKKNYADINTIPFPARNHLRDRDFRFYRKKGVSIISSRGCPNRCDFCTSRELWGNKYRARSIGSLIDEIDTCVTRHKTTLFNFEDDNLMASHHHAKELLDGLLAYQKRKEVSLDLTAMNGLSLEHINEDIITPMRRSGFTELNISLVSRSDTILKTHGRPFDSNRVKHISNMAHSIGMRVRAYFILGLPDQTKDEIEDTIHFMRDINVMMFPSIFYDVKRPRDEWKMQRSSAFFNETKYLSRKDLLYYFNLTLSLNKNLSRS
jgi:radical SAM superfamily enzyme YgiQ (UPF0313 family)